jgi:concanavalin A-like lectin/glucanase superfamily protein
MKAIGVTIRRMRGAFASCLFVSAAMLGLLATNHADVQTCTPPPSGMVSWWPGDGNANDIQGSNNGTSLNGATFSAGEVGQAFSLDGVDDEIAINHTAALNFGHNDSFSVDAWLKAPNSVLGTQRAAVSLTYVCSRESILLSLLTDGTIDFSIRDSNNIDIDTISPSSIVDGQWHHVAGVRDTANHTVQLYLDGVCVASLPDTTTGTFTRADAQDRIGSIPVACPTDRYFWAGEIDEVEVFNGALSASEVQAIYDAGSAGKCEPLCTTPPPDMVSWWPGDGNANDIQGNNNGTLLNGVTFTVGKVGTTFSFDGVDDMISHPKQRESRNDLQLHV